MPSRKGRAAPRDTGNRILDAAVALFCERGYKGTTTRAIAERARVNEVTVFRRFGTKQGLFMAVVQRETDVTEALSAFELRPTGDMVADLTRVGREMHSNMTSRTALFKLIMTEVTRDPSKWASVSHAPFSVIAKLEAYFREARRLGMARDVDPHLAAVAFFSFFFRALVATSFLGRDVFIGEEGGAVEGFVRIFVNGIQMEAHG